MHICRSSEYWLDYLVGPTALPTPWAPLTCSRDLPLTIGSSLVLSRKHTQTHTLNSEAPCTFRSLWETAWALSLPDTPTPTQGLLLACLRFASEYTCTHHALLAWRRCRTGASYSSHRHWASHSPCSHPSLPIAGFQDTHHAHPSSWQPHAPIAGTGTPTGPSSWHHRLWLSAPLVWLQWLAPNPLALVPPVAGT